MGGGSGDDGTSLPDAAGSGSGSGAGAVSVFDPSITRVVVEIDYETGEPPYTGNIVAFGDTFAPTMANIDRVFAHKKMLTIPQTLSDMQDVGTIPDEELTVADIQALAAMFKDVIKGTGSLANPNTERYVEQSTLVHELSHSIGLVDNGVPMVAPHKDAAHGAHCNNSNCVMYWLNEGAADARTFAINRVLTGSSILFDDACLADVDALTGGP
jgi:hypothetical protein